MSISRLCSVIASALVTSVVLAACGASSSTVTTEYDDVPTRIEVTGTTGDVFIDANSQVAGVEIEAVTTNATIMSTFDNGVLVVTDDCDDEDCSVDYIIQLRGDVDVAIVSTSGAVTLTEVTGAVTIEAETGLLTLNTVTGPIDATIETGNIIGTRLVSDAATFTSTTGDIDVTFDEPISDLVAMTTTGYVTAQIPTDAYVINATTETGSIDLSFESDPGADKTVTLSTETGDITVYEK